MKIQLSFRRGSRFPFQDPQSHGHLNGYDDYKRSRPRRAARAAGHRGRPFKGGKVEEADVIYGQPAQDDSRAGVDVGDKMIGETSRTLWRAIRRTVSTRPLRRLAKAAAAAASARPFPVCRGVPGVNGGEAAAADVYADDYLYDLRVDPVQLNNVVADPAYAEAAMLRGRLLDWIKRAEALGRPLLTE